MFLSKLVILKVCIYRLMLDNIFCELFSPENILFLKMTNSLSFLINQPVEGVLVLCWWVISLCVCSIFAWIILVFEFEFVFFFVSACYRVESPFLFAWIILVFEFEFVFFFVPAFYQVESPFLSEFTLKAFRTSLSFSVWRLTEPDRTERPSVDFLILLAKYH